MTLPRSALLSLWLNACLDGTVGVDDFAVEVRAEDPQHLVLGWPGTDGPVRLEQLPSLVTGLGTSARLALPTAGDPLGLGGPPPFNAEAVEAGEAVLIGSQGLIPVLDARTVLWRSTPATPAPLLDPAEEGRQLRQVLLHATNELVRLDVASWSPEIPDLLMNLRHRPGLAVPGRTPPQAIETLERATLCLEIVELARTDDGGAISAHEVGARARCLTDLDVAARRAIVAVCSASLLAS
ncbi:hypothetical protein EFK50_01810 [Nocardioides marmoriginsengisoli]|uniref:Uncharacterized protein n=1 Tax=Nocardioides marmoriginsengisoli TaxID=661483 RepID=A0A3N0CQS6_9ACTN|nr:hypothetical protein [Nocardioides marmoriginsengisoli]RNL65805.1 hypothetical protein EFK50_01810 [Nocardioides marmoriginsengisoli]